jgi:intracellular septation protein
MTWKTWFKRAYPFNAEQTVNILSEFGPLVTMFVVNALYGITVGTWALILTTALAMACMKVVLGRLPVFPIIASSVTIVFGTLTLVTGDPKWVQIKVTIFNVMFAIFLFAGLALRRNFFKYVFGQTFHYTEKGWDRFTFSFAWFFVFTAILNEIVRLSFKDTQIYQVLGFYMNGVNVWILFKVAIIMPLSALYAWWLTKLMQKYRVALEPALSRATYPDGSSDPLNYSQTEAQRPISVPRSETGA